MQPWKTKVLCAGRYRPRQFEYHPLYEDVVVFGTLRGEAVVADVANNSVSSSISSGLSRDKNDSILGLCWLKQSPSRFVVGSSHGFLRLCDAGPMPSAGARAGGVGLEGHDLSSRSSAVQEAVPFNGAVRATPATHVPSASQGKIISEFDKFDKLTSVHINSSDDQMLASGYTYGVKLYDLATGQIVRAFDDIHEDHINISRFANHSPFVFATSSFDKTVKTWDSRVRADKAPIYTCRSEMGHVMLSFSPDDVFLLTSAVDNEVKQYLALDGRLHMDLDIPKTGMDENFTRSYYTSSGRLILSGSSEEQTVRLYCAQTGRLIHSAEMYPGRKHGSLYVQSLRGDPHHDFQFSVLVNYRDTAYPLEIVTVDMLQGTNGEDLSSLTAYASSSRLSADLGRACVDKEGADVFIVARDRSRFLAHKAVISCRSEVLGGLLADAVASGRKQEAADTSKLRLVASSNEGGRSADTNAAADENGAEDGVVPASVCLPRAVAPDIVPVILAFLYTDRLVQQPDFGPDGCAEEYLDPGVEGTSSFAGGSMEAGPGGSGRDHGKGKGIATQSKVAFFEKVLEAAGSLQLERLSSLVEWECRQLVNTVTVLSVASVALRQGTEQLLEYCVHYLGTHLKPVLELHGRGCLPPVVQARVDEERLRRVYALNSESNVSSVPDVVMSAVTSTLAPSGQANSGSAAASAADHANGEVAGGGAPGAHATTPANAVVNAAWRSAEAGQAQVEDGEIEGGDNAANPPPLMPANGDNGAENNGNAVHQAPNGPEPMEEEEVEEDPLMDEPGFDSEEEEQDDDDSFIDEEVDEEDDQSMSEADTLSEGEDEDEGAWLEPSHGGGNLPAVVRRRLVPTVTGHTATAVLGSQMMVLGGGNKRQFHSCRHVLVYDPIERTWSKLATRGHAPAALIYHSCTALEPPWGCPRNLLVFGGNSTHRHMNTNARQQAQVSVLDSLTMEWLQPKVQGDPIGVRTRHTAVAVHADYDQHERATAEMHDKHFAGQFEGLTADELLFDTTEEERDIRRGKGCGKRRAHPSERPDPRDFGGDTDVIIFGGFSPIAGQAYNDVVVLNVRRSRGKFSANGCSGSNTPDGDSLRGGDSVTAFSSSSGGEHPARRRRHSRGSQPVWDSDDSDGCDANDCEQRERERERESKRESERESTTADGSHHGYTYSWVHPIVRGTPPVGRLAHSAAVVRLMDGEGGSGSGQQAYMVVFGGVGTGQLFNDVSVLRCSSTRTLEWERVFVRGRRPARRYGHSMIPLSAPSGLCGYARLVLFGGTSGHSAYNDIFVLNISRGRIDGQHGILAKWESLATQVEGDLPCPRSRQTLCQLNGELIVFGGSDESPGTHNNQPASKEVDAHVFHLRPRLRRKAIASSERNELGSFGGGNGGGRGGGGGGGTGSFVPPQQSAPRTGAVRHDRALLRWHERAMATEVVAHLGLVEAAQERRAEAARMAAVNHLSPRLSALRLAEEGTRLAGRASSGGSNRGHEQGLPRFLSTASEINAHWENTLAQAEQAERGRALLFHERLHQPSPRPHGVKVVWECIQPDAFVFEPGPEPPVVIKPGQLHKDIQTLISNGQFSDVKFRFQAVDFTLPTTPTNTAHYAIVLPPTPTLSPKSGIPSPVNGALATRLVSSNRSPRTRSEKSGAAGNGGVGTAAASRLPAVDSFNGDDSGSGASTKAGSRHRSVQSVVTRSSAGQELEILSPARCVSPAGGWSIINRPSSCSPLGSGHRSAAGGRRRFFGLSEAAEAEAEAAAMRADGEACKGGAAARGEGPATPTAGKRSGAAGNHVIDAHRFLLCLRSDPMRAMLRSGMKETFASVCLLKDIRPPVFSALLTYIYTDTLQLQRPEDITELLVVANQYTLTDLLSLCEGFLQGVLDEENASHLYHYADSLAMPTFEHRCLTFILRNWRSIIRTEGWSHLPPELRARANAFRTKETHLFMLGQKDHATWKGGEKDMMADWVFDRASNASWIDELTQETFVKSGEEGWHTASEGGDSDGAAFFSPNSQSPC